MADAPVRYVFSATGEKAVTQAFASISEAARRSQRATESAFAAQARASRAQTQGGGASARLYREAERTAAKIEKELAREAKAAQQAAAAKARAAQQAAAAGERAAKQQATAEARAAQQAAAAQIRAREHVFQIRARHHAQEERVERQAAARQARRAEQTARAEARAQARIADARSRSLGRIAEGGADRVLGGARNLAFAGGAIVTGLVGAAARESVKLSDLSTRIAISARESGKEAVDPATLRREFEATALATPGQSATDVAEAVQTFVGKTGRLDVARAQAKTFATVASATGGDVQDVAAAAADLFQKFDITSIEDMQAAFAALAIQGKEGSFELKDAASQFAKLSAAASRFGLDKGAGGVATLGGLTQIARSATGSPEQAASAVEATLRQLVSKSGDIKRDLGVDIFADKGKTRTRNVQDVLVETIGGAKGSLPKLQEIFGEEGIRGISPLISTFNEAKAKATGSEEERVAAGMAALRAQLDKAINVTGGWAEVQKDASLAQQTAGASLSAAWESVKANVSESLTPALVALAPHLIALAPALIPVIEKFGELASALGVFLAMLEDYGIIGKRETGTKLPADAAEQDIQRQIDAIENAPGTMTADDVQRVQDLEEQRAMLAETRDQNKAQDLAEQMGTAPIKNLADLTEEQYQAKRAALMTPEQVAYQTNKDPLYRGNNEAQQALDKERSADVTNRNTPVSAVGGPDASAAQQAAAAALKDAAAALKEAASANNQPSIIGPG